MKGSNNYVRVSSSRYKDVLFNYDISLVQAGYRIFSPNRDFDVFDALFQKKMPLGYYLNLQYYAYVGGSEGWAGNVQFTTAHRLTFNVDLLITPKDTLGDVENFFNTLFERMGCVIE